mgnify:FL=1
MKRIILMFLKNFFYLPKMFIKLSRYAKNVDNYSYQELYDFIRNITHRAVNTGKVKVNVEGIENIPKDENFIFYPNHQGSFDVLAIVEVCPVPFSVVYKKELKDIPFLKNVFKCLHSKYIDREDIRQSLTVINEMAKEVSDGHNFLIFSEGTRSRNGNKLLEFKGGSFKAAYKAKCKVVPVALVDTYKVFDTGSIKKQAVTVKFLPPIDYETYKTLKTPELAELVHDNIEKAIEIR